ncbi:MAG: hypothetical protein ABWX65_11710 [Mycetocola sp.]
MSGNTHNGSTDEPPPAIRAQLLATEHWGLLAARSTAQSEVLSRISILLTLVSAGLVSLALVGQATGFSDAFIGFAIGVLSFIVLVGVLTQVRVMNIGMEDLMYVIAMNRLRGAYVELVPGIDRAFLASPHDDFAGVQQTYYFFTPKRNLSQLFGSTMVFIILINAALVGLLTAATTLINGAATLTGIIAGSIVAIAFFVVSFGIGNRQFHSALAAYTSAFPSASATAETDPLP